MIKSGFVLVLIAAVIFFLFNRIAKLPSRYDRNPGKLSSWSSLDRGIDPSLPSESDE